MKSQTILFISVVMLCLYSCNKKHNKITLPIIDIEKAMDHLTHQKINFSEFIDSITYVPLETSDTILIGGRFSPSIHITDNYIFYGNYMFRRNGKYVDELGKKGQGPGEYTLALDYGVNEMKKEFYVYANKTRKIYIYDFDNTFKRSFSCNPRGGGFRLLKNGNILLSRDGYGYFNDFFEYMILDSDSGSVIYEYKNQNVDESYTLQELVGGKFWTYNGQEYYFDRLAETIFSLDENGNIKSPHYIINFGKYSLYHDKSNALIIKQMVECQKYLFFNILYKNDLYYAAYNKQTGEVLLNKFYSLLNNNIDGGFLWLFNETLNSDLGYCIVSPDWAKEHIHELSSKNINYDKSRNETLTNLINSTSEEDNDIVCFYHLK